MPSFRSNIDGLADALARITSRISALERSGKVTGGRGILVRQAGGDFHVEANDTDFTNNGFFAEIISYDSSETHFPYNARFVEWNDGSDISPEGSDEANPSDHKEGSTDYGHIEKREWDGEDRLPRNITLKCRHQGGLLNLQVPQIVWMWKVKARSGGVESTATQKPANKIGDAYCFSLLHDDKGEETEWGSESDRDTEWKDNYENEGADEFEWAINDQASSKYGTIGKLTRVAKVEDSSSDDYGKWKVFHREVSVDVNGHIRTLGEEEEIGVIDTGSCDGTPYSGEIKNYRMAFSSDSQSIEIYSTPLTFSEGVLCTKGDETLEDSIYLRNSGPCCPCDVDDLPETICVVKYEKCTISYEGQCRDCFTISSCNSLEKECCDYGSVYYDESADAWATNGGHLESTGCRGTEGPLGDYYNAGGDLVAKVIAGDCTSISLDTEEGDIYSCSGITSDCCSSGINSSLRCNTSDCSGINCEEELS